MMKFTYLSIFLFCIVQLTAQKGYDLISTYSESRTATVKFEKPVILSWISPSTASPAYEKNRTFIASMRIVSPYEITEKEIVIFVNGRILDGKSGEGKIKNKKSTYRGIEFIFEKEIQVSDTNEETTLKVVYNAPTGIGWPSSEMTIKHVFDNQQSTLHLLSIGVGKYNDYSELPNLKFPENDAEAVYDLFTKNRGLFGKVNQLDLLTGQNANSSNLIAQLNSLQQLALNGDIKKEDLILIYISSHGVLVDGDFRIATSDYRIQAKERSSVSYRREILKVLNQIDCKKIIFLDACHSGGGSPINNSKGDEDNLADAIQLLINTPSGISTIASSTKNEESYELDTYQHGSFTQAILEGLAGKADANSNSIIDLNELFDYVEIRVPELNKEEGYPVQTPTRSDNELGGLPIFTN